MCPNLTHSLDAVTQLLSLGSPSAQAVAKSFNAVGSAALQIEAAQRQFQEISKISGSTMGTAIFSGNLLTIGIGLFQALSGSPTPDQMILEAIGEIRNQISELSSDMREGFVRIDKRFDEIEKNINASFIAVLDYFVEADERNQRRLNSIISSLETLRLQVLSLDENLYRVESSLFQTVSDIADRDFSKLAMHCSLPLSLALYKSCRSDLLLFGNDFSKKVLSTKTNSSTDFTNDAAILEFLAANPDSPSRLNYLMGVANYDFGLTSSANNVANPRAWMAATHAFLEMSRANSAISLSASTAKEQKEALKALQKTGIEIEKAVLDLSVQNDEGRYAFFKQANLRYTKALEILKSVIKKFDEEYSQQNGGMGLRSLYDIQSTGGIDNELSVTGSLLDTKKISATINGDSRTKIAWETAQFGQVDNWLPRKLLAAKALEQVTIDADISARWKGQLEGSGYYDSRDCGYRTIGNGSVGVMDCTFTKRTSDFAEVTRSAKAKDVKNDNEIHFRSRTQSTSGRVPRSDCSVRCQTPGNDQSRCFRELEQPRCTEFSPIQAVLGVSLSGAQEETRQDTGVITEVVGRAIEIAAQKKAAIENKIAVDPDTQVALRKMRASVSLLDAYLRIVREVSFIENDRLVSALHSDVGIPIEAQVVIPYAMAAYLNPDNHPIKTAWTELGREIDRFQARLAARDMSPSIEPVESLLGEIGMEIQMLQMKEDRGSPERAIKKFLSQATSP